MIEIFIIFFGFQLWQIQDCVAQVVEIPGVGAGLPLSSGEEAMASDLVEIPVGQEVVRGQLGGCGVYPERATEDGRQPETARDGANSRVPLADASVGFHLY